jgi:AcrR family transcriptional regulator
VARLPQHLAKVPVGRERLSREALSSHQRERILAAAKGVFARRGYQETTIDNIVAAAKASVGSFYSLFQGKEDCFLAVYQLAVDRSRAQFAAAVEPASSWAEEAYLGLREMLAIFVADPAAARIILIEAQTAGAEAARCYEALLDAAAAWLRAGRDARPEAAELPPSFEQAGIAGLAYYLQQCLHGSGPKDVEELFAETAPILLEPMLGAAELRRLRGELTGARA